MTEREWRLLQHKKERDRCWTPERKQQLLQDTEKLLQGYKEEVNHWTENKKAQLRRARQESERSSNERKTQV